MHIKLSNIEYALNDLFVNKKSLENLIIKLLLFRLISWLALMRERDELGAEAVGYDVEENDLVINQIRLGAFTPSVSMPQLGLIALSQFANEIMSIAFLLTSLFF